MDTQETKKSLEWVTNMGKWSISFSPENYRRAGRCICRLAERAYKPLQDANFGKNRYPQKQQFVKIIEELRTPAKLEKLLNEKGIYINIGITKQGQEFILYKMEISMEESVFNAIKEYYILKINELKETGLCPGLEEVLANPDEYRLGNLSPKS